MSLRAGREDDGRGSGAVGEVKSRRRRRGGEEAAALVVRRVAELGMGRVGRGAGVGWGLRWSTAALWAWMGRRLR